MKKNYNRNWLFYLKSMAVFGSMLFAGAVSAQLSGTYTINSGAATSGTNYASFTAFATAINGVGVSGPVTVNVVSGSGPYNQAVTFTASGTATNTVTINGNGNTIKDAAGAVITLNGADYFTFDNLKVDASGNVSGARCYWIYNNADNNTIKNSELIVSSNTTTGSGTAYIALSASATSRTAGSHGTNNVIDNNTMRGNGTNSGPYSGVSDYRSSSTKSGSLTITNNNIKHCYYGHFYIYYTAGFDIRNNTLTTYRSDAQSGTGTTYPAYFYYCGGTTQCKFNDNTITGLGGYYMYGVYVYECDGTAANPTQVNNNSFTSNSSGYYFYGPRMYYSNYSEVKNNTISSNSATYYNYGIQAQYNNDVIIQDNLIENNTAYYIYPFYNYAYNCSNITIDRNRVFNNDALYYFYNYMVYYGSNVQCTNNILAGNSATYFNYNFLYYPVSGVYAHNTIVQDQYTSYYNYGVYAYFNGATDFKVSNNIIYTGGTSGYGYSHQALYAGGTMTNVSFSNNVYHETSACSYVNGSTTSSSATAYVASGAETNSVAEDPGFVNLAALNVTPTNPKISNMGLQGLAALDQKIVTRTSCGPDPGAIEFFIDHSVSALSTLPSTECGNYEEEVKLRFQNGSAVAMTGVKMFYQINGGTPVVETLSSAAGSTSTDFTFNKKARFNKPGVNTLTFGLGCDDNTANNTITQTVSITSSPEGSDLTMGSQFDGYFNDGDMGNPDVTVKDYVSKYNVTNPVKATNITYSLKAMDEAMTDVTSSGFTLSSTTLGAVLTADPATSLSGKRVFLQMTTLDNITGCDTTFGRYMYIPETPVADFIATNICLGDVAQFKNKSTLAASKYAANYITTKWEFNDPDASITDDNSDILDGFWEYTKYGSGVNVEMTVVNGLYPKFEYSKIKTINVTPKPEVDFKVLNACEGSNITIVNNTRISTGGAITYVWDFAGVYTSTSASPKYTFATPGQRKITVVATSSGCKAELTKNAYQFEKPVANFVSQGKCNFVDVTFNSTSTIPNNGNMGYKWDFASEGISRAKSPAFAFATAGKKIVKLTATSEFGCESTATKEIVLDESPVADFTWDAACNLTPINFTRTGSVPNGGINSSMTWDFNGEGTSTGTNGSTHQFPKVGSKLVTLKIADGNGCSNSITKEVNVVLQAVANFDVASVCQGDETQFTGKSSVAAGNLTYKWTFGDGTTPSTDHSPKHTYSTSGSYNVTLEANVVGGCSDVISKSVFVNPAPDATWTFTKAGRNVVLNSTADNNDAYKWTFGDGSRATDANPTYNYDNVDLGTFTICLATRKGICWSEDCKEITVDLAGIADLTESNDMINVYPNPTSGKFTVSVDNAGKDAVVKVGDILGNVISARVIDNLNGTYSVDMSAVADGVYFVQVKNGDYFATKRITVSK